MDANFPIKAVIRAGRWISSVKWSPDGQYLAYIIDSTVKILSSETNKTITEFKFARYENLRGITWGPNSDHLATCVSIIDGQNSRTRVEILLVAENRTTCLIDFTGHGETLKPLWSPCGKYLAVIRSILLDHRILIWSFEDRRILNNIIENQEVGSIAWSPDGSYLAITLSSNENRYIPTVTDTIKIVKAPEFEFEFTLTDTVSNISAMEWAPDNSSIITSSNKDIKIWRFAHHDTNYQNDHVNPYGTAEVKTVGKSSYSKVITWSPNSEYFAFDNKSKYIRIKKIGYKSVRLPTGNVTLKTIASISWSPTGKLLAASGAGGLLIWDVSSFVLNTAKAVDF